MKKLFLCRHAKSSWKDASLADIDRPLNKRGKRDAPLMGRRLVNYEVFPDAVFSSPARRARKTAERICRELDYPKKQITIVREMYGASPSELLEMIQNFSDTYSQVIMVGHNPETTLFANLLGNLKLINVPTCGIVALQFPFQSWKEIDYGSGEHVFFEYPKKNDSIIGHDDG